MKELDSKLVSQLFDSLLEPAFILDQEGHITYCNEPAALILDSSPKRLSRGNKLFSDCFEFAQPVGFLGQLSSVTDATPYEEIRFQVKGSEKQGRVQVTCQKVGSEFLVYFRDVTLEETLQKKYHRELEQKQSYIEELEKARAELENYSKNLEKMVQERTLEISKLNELLGALIDSLDQGFLIFDANGSVLPVASRACSETLEKDPKGKAIWDVLGLESKKAESFKKWMQTAFSEMLPFEDLAPLAPSQYQHSRGKSIKLSYYPMRAENQIAGIVLVATDQTDLIAAQKLAEQEKAHVSMVLKLIKQKRQILKFTSEAKNLFADLISLVQQAQPDTDLVFRLLHTLKGASALFSIKSVVDACHAAEEALHLSKSDPAQFEQCKQWSLVARNAFQQFLSEAQSILGPLNETQSETIEVRSDLLFDFASTHLSPQTPAAKDFFQKFLFQKASDCFSGFNEPLQELAERLGKKISSLHITPPQFMLLAKPYDPLFQEFIHAFRNSLDHGIEAPDQRLEAKKLPEGQIRIDFKRLAPAHNGQETLRIIIQDDGQGIDPKKLRAKLERNHEPHEHLSDEEILQCVLRPQFSTREEVSLVSGRGVGLDALAAQVKSLGGQIWVESTLGQGTKILMDLPWIEDLSGSNDSAQVQKAGSF